jgi:two-component system cell cycle response regulator
MKPTILLVDDNEEILEFLTMELQDKYKLLTAFNGYEALQLLNNEPAQLIISDIMMPIIDGFELCSQIKSDLNFSHIPIILLTAKDTLQSKIMGLELGADAYIEKPFSPEHLEVQIASLLKNRNNIKAYFASSPMVHINTMAYTTADEKFLERLNAVINNNLTNADLDVEHLSNLMNISRPTLYRKIKAISDLTPNELINIARLKKATEMLNEGTFKMVVIAEMVGYTSQNHFGRNFSKQFGVTPSEYLHTRGQNR